MFSRRTRRRLVVLLTAVVVIGGALACLRVYAGRRWAARAVDDWQAYECFRSATESEERFLQIRGRCPRGFAALPAKTRAKLNRSLAKAFTWQRDFAAAAKYMEAAKECDPGFSAINRSLLLYLAALAQDTELVERSADEVEGQAWDELVAMARHFAAQDFEKCAEMDLFTESSQLSLADSAYARWSWILTGEAMARMDDPEGAAAALGTALGAEWGSWGLERWTVFLLYARLAHLAEMAGYEEEALTAARAVYRSWAVFGYKPWDNDKQALSELIERLEGKGVGGEPYVTDEFAMSIPKGWRNVPSPSPGPRKLLLNGDGIGARPVDETGHPLRVGLMVEKYPGTTDTLAEGADGLVAEAKADPKLETIGEATTESLQLPDGTDAILLTTEFIKEKSRRSLQMKLLAKDKASNGWVVSGYVVGGKDSTLPRADSWLANKLRGYLESFRFDGAKPVEPGSRASSESGVAPESP